MSRARDVVIDIVSDDGGDATVVASSSRGGGGGFQGRSGRWCRPAHVIVALFVACTCAVVYELGTLVRGPIMDVAIGSTRATLTSLGVDVTGKARRGDAKQGDAERLRVGGLNVTDDDVAVVPRQMTTKKATRGGDIAAVVKANDPAVDMAVLCGYVGVDARTFERDRGAAFAPARAFVDGVHDGRDAVSKALDKVFGVVKSLEDVDGGIGVIHAHAMPGDVVVDVERYAADVAEQFNVWGVRDVDVVLTGVEESAREILERVVEFTTFKPRRVMYESETTAMKMVREAFAAAQLAPHSGTFLAGISRADSMFITPDYTTPSRGQGSSENSTEPMSKTMSVAVASATRWRMWNPYVNREDFIVSLGAVRAKAEAGECEELWGWNCLRDRYKLTTLQPAAEGTKIIYTASRSQRHDTARGQVTMEATWMHVPVKRVAIDVSHVADAPSGNPWHRLTAIYGAFLTKNKFFPNRTDVDVLFGCGSNTPVSAPPGWEKIGTPKCEREQRTANYDVIASSPRDGHLWDLAWDYDLPCKDEDLFKAFVEVVTPNAFSPPDVPFKNRPACWIARQSGRIRSVGNEAEVIEAMKAASGDAGFQYLEITSQTTLMETITAVQNCGILVGLHGAGMINQIYALVDTTVIEIVPPGVAYYKNVAQLRDQKYVPVFYQGSTNGQNIVVPIDALKNVLRDVYARRRRRAQR
jgi:hypothetical protein